MRYYQDKLPNQTYDDPTDDLMKLPTKNFSNDRAAGRKSIFVGAFVAISIVLVGKFLFG